jgi:hypothetical protein
MPYKSAIRAEILFFGPAGIRRDGKGEFGGVSAFSLHAAIDGGAT